VNVTINTFNDMFISNIFSAKDMDVNVLPLPGNAHCFLLYTFVSLYMQYTSNFMSNISNWKGRPTVSYSKL
jgi:hypothetical protein